MSIAALLLMLLSPAHAQDVPPPPHCHIPPPVVVPFGPGDVSLDSEDADRLAFMVEIAREGCFQDMQLQVTGHRDGEDAPTASAARVEAVIEYLLSHGLPRARLVKVDAGDTEPRMVGTQGKREPQNRRVELMILPPNPTR